MKCQEVQHLEGKIVRGASTAIRRGRERHVVKNADFPDQEVATARARSVELVQGDNSGR